MRKIFLTMICCFSIGAISAQEKLSKEEKARREKNIQAGNPFIKYGSKAPVATLSKGKYLEVHDLDSIVTIGTMRWNVEKKEIVGQIKIDSLNVDAQPIGDVPGRWMSPDPLSEEYRRWSPYNYCIDNPVRLVDRDGMSAGDIYNLDGEHVGSDGIADNAVYLLHTNSNTQLTESQSKLLIQGSQSPGTYVGPKIEQKAIGNDELNLRASLSTLKQTEAGAKNKPLDYNSWNNNKNFTEDSYAKNPDAYSKHPGTNIDSGGSAAGAYQFLSRFYKGADFSPKSQDASAVNNMTSSSFNAATSGNGANFKSTTQGRWTSLKSFTVAAIQILINTYRAEELKGKSSIATPVGQLAQTRN